MRPKKSPPGAQAEPVARHSRAACAPQTATIKARVAGELVGLDAARGRYRARRLEVARTDPTESNACLRQAQQQADAARTQVDIASASLANNRALVDQGFISPTAGRPRSRPACRGPASYQARAAAEGGAARVADMLRAPIDGQDQFSAWRAAWRINVREARIVEMVDARAWSWKPLSPGRPGRQSAWPALPRRG